MPNPHPRDSPGRDHDKLKQEHRLARRDLGEPLAPAPAGMKCAGYH